MAFWNFSFLPLLVWQYSSNFWFGHFFQYWSQVQVLTASQPVVTEPESTIYILQHFVQAKSRTSRISPNGIQCKYAASARVPKSFKYNLME
ncbi:uncharacterized protein F5147DRAFT_692782 [Suillus discolor]|uniref:Secreted protein n=1 Tax=Suillus discolor TaxID=1912936 RepID=A0A9P7F9C0_9AGAM|nr:uncharacterized protein F5147DRAFT_692782 [Suillus discolor]KAG2109322.1 hypothetical protein F5147DRAFT_692782 [Suillus discolor]